VSSAAQSMLGRLPAEVFQANFVLEMVSMFREQAERCLHLENSGLRIWDLFLGPANDRVHSADRLEEATGWLQVM
jgi:hypothetical protein